MKSAFTSVATAAAIGLGLLTLGSLGGCSSTTTMTYLPSGDTGFAINCSGSDASSSWAECYKRAGEVCGNYGYDVVSKDVDNGATSGGSVGGIFGANVKNRSMVVRCKQYRATRGDSRRGGASAGARIDAAAKRESGERDRPDAGKNHQPGHARRNEKDNRQ